MIVAEVIDVWLAEERQRRDAERLLTQREGYFWPTECSVPYEVAPGIVVNIGGCRRKAYYRWHKLGVTNPVQPKSIRKMVMGEIIEEKEREWYRKSGIVIAEKIKFQDPTHFVSGECDAAVYDPEVGIIGVEVKSYAGYFAEREIEGTKNKPGFPRLDNLLQTMIYLDRTKLPEFRICYTNRATAEKTEFRIILSAGGFAMVKNMHRGYESKFTGFSVSDVWPRMSELRTMIGRKQLPECDYKEVYSAEEIKARYTHGLISKTAYESYHKSGDPIGDWQCYATYCSYYDRCKGLIAPAA